MTCNATPTPHTLTDLLAALSENRRQFFELLECIERHAGGIELDPLAVSVLIDSDYPDGQHPGPIDSRRLVRQAAIGDLACETMH